MSSGYKDANFPLTAEGRSLHLKTRRGDICNRVINVSSHLQGARIAALLDNPTKVFRLISSRGFTIHTGLFSGIPVTIIASGVGVPMVDFVVREARAVVDGPLAFIRLGACGSPMVDAPLGSCVVASEGSRLIRFDFDAYQRGDTDLAALYPVSKAIAPDAEMSAGLCGEIASALPSLHLVTGLNLTSASSFYCSQGRSTALFDDRNTDLMEDLVRRYPNLASLDMETHQLYMLAALSKGVVRVTAASSVVATGHSDEFLTTEKEQELEVSLAVAALKTLAALKLEGEMETTLDVVWHADNLSAHGVDCSHPS